ncbi:MAG: acyl-ACP--UDP-N-acetylglucosamine O-acyltransferase [Rhodobacteraceae bacterium]|nr:acyl-ACP--UDP-N-acetylglucosamine O-acyltransferase [Paracoccaceae bacterium]
MTIAPTARIHASSVVEPGAVIGDRVEIGPFCVVGPEVALGPDVVLRSHAVVTGRTDVGEGSVVFPGAVVGEIPQDLKYRGEATRLSVGKRNRIREGATLNIGTEGGGGMTRVGDDCLFMTGAHVGHDVLVGDRVILANQAALAGHCIIEDDVIIGGLSGIHQFVRIGRGAMIGAVTMVTADVIPFGLVQGPRGTLDGLNLVGLKRRGIPRGDITALRAAFRSLADSEGAFLDRARRLAAESDSVYVREIVDFVQARSDRQFLTPR